jgi:hypothetical protein
MRGVRGRFYLSDSELRAVHSLLLGGPKQWEEFRSSREKSKAEFGQFDNLLGRVPSFCRCEEAGLGEAPVLPFWIFGII